LGDPIDAVLCAGVRRPSPGAPDWIGLESVKLIVRMMRDAFPDFTETIEDVVAEADHVVTRFTSTGAHLGALRGLAPTGRRIWMAEMAIFRVARGRIVEKRGLFDRLGMVQQLGIMPPAWPW
jgi:predicted ester cyclase